MFTLPKWIKTLHALSHKQLLALIIPVLILLLFFLKSYSHHPPPPLYHIGRNSSWPGLHLMGRERNLTAFSDELLLLIAKNEQMDVQVFGGSSQDLLNKLKNHTLDGILAQEVKDSQARFVLSDPYYLLGPVLVIPIHPVDHTYKMIGANPQSAHAIDLQDHSTIQIQLYQDLLKALTDLNANRIDGVLFPALEAFSYVRTFYPTTLKIGTPPLTDEGLRLIALKTQKGEELIHRFNQGLAQLKQDGTYDALIEKWDLVNTAKLDH